jgi:glucose/arabinose dehydrogenase
VTQAQPRRLSAGVIINIGIIVLGVIAIIVLVVARLVSDEPAVSTEPLDLSVALEMVAVGLDSPVLLVGAGDGSDDRYVVEQAGRVIRLAPDGMVDPKPLLDITDRVLHQHERGLLGLAFHPAFAENGRFFVTYSRRDDGATSISEFTVPSEGDAEAPPVESSERALLTIPQPYTTHKGGMLAFDRDGMLLAGIGDGGHADDPQKNGQDRASLLGKLLRLDVDRGWPYATPEDNGFSDDARAKPEIHAVGLRNPWRFSVDRESGDVYIGDVGQREWEEINVLPPGAREASFGWSEMEGRECFGGDCQTEAHIDPAVTYPHVEGEAGPCAVIGGYAYRGVAGSLPDGTYLYADYCSDSVWAVAAEQLRADKAAPAVVGQVPPEYGQTASFGEDDAGELYLLTDAGYVLRISQSERS